MAHLTKAVAQGILDGQGYTDNEVRQLASAWLKGVPEGQNPDTAHVAVHLGERSAAMPEGYWLAPDVPNERMLRPFIECPEDELLQGYMAMKMLCKAYHPVEPKGNVHVDGGNGEGAAPDAEAEK